METENPDRVDPAWTVQLLNEGGENREKKCRLPSLALGSRRERPEASQLEPLDPSAILFDAPIGLGFGKSRRGFLMNQWISMPLSAVS